MLRDAPRWQRATGTLYEKCEALITRGSPVGFCRLLADPLFGGRSDLWALGFDFRPHLIAAVREQNDVMARTQRRPDAAG